MTMSASPARQETLPPMAPPDEFAALYEKYAGVVYRTALRITGR